MLTATRDDVREVVPNDACVRLAIRVAYDDSVRAVEFGSPAYKNKTYSFEVTLVER